MHLADLITEMNGFCGFMSVLASLRYCQSDPSDLANLWLAFGFMPFGLFFDFLDGKVARWRKKSSLMGQELDSLADLVCPQENILFLAADIFPDFLRCCPCCCWLHHRVQDHC